MSTRWLALTIATSFSLFAAAYSQIPPKPAPKADDSQEASVLEQMLTQVTFDNEGRRSREQTTRVRVKSDAGVQQWGLLSIQFQSAVETVDVVYVRVRKPDGSIVTTPPDNVQDLDAQITRDAPFYSDLREKHIAVKGLGKGDVLEYQVDWHPTKALIPGQFWFEYNFDRAGVVLDERLEIKVPADRAVKFKGPPATQTIKTEGASRIYTWTSSRAPGEKETQTDRQKIEAALGRAPAPDVQLSSFHSWEEVGQWYWSLQKDRFEPSAAVREKAAELTKGLTNDSAKLQALYSFVSIRYRYIGIAFGIGRHQPHAADDVLSNNYGDCKDKHTLLAALLQASGITLYPALINSSRNLDPDVPSPAQFDHIIGYLPQGQTALWLDTTPEVGPIGYLVSPLRNKPALVMSGEKSAQLITTPSDLPFPSHETFKVEGKLGDDGTFEAHIQHTSRGDGEVLLRSAFRRVPQPQWKDLVQQISYGLNYAGTVSDINASAPEVTTEPFNFSYSYHRKEYPDWTNHQLTVPGLPFFMSIPKDDAKDPVWLGATGETVSDSKVELPKPSNVDLKYDFAEYHATYSQDNGVLIAKRSVQVKMHEVPVAELDDYRSFVKNVQNDLSRYVQTSSVNTPAQQGVSKQGGFPGFMAGIRQLPDSSSAEANRMEADARNLMRQNNLSAAITAFRGVVDTDAKFARAWVELATLYMSQRQGDVALDALRAAINSDPKQLVVHKIYAYALISLRRNDDALQAWRDTLKIAPDDPDANEGTASLLMQDKRDAEALPFLEAFAKTDTSPGAQVRLGSAYLGAGQTEKGTAILQKVLDADSTPMTLNDVAYDLADAGAALPKALEYAQRAVEEQEKQSHDVELSNLTVEDLFCTQRIGFIWDTLGWAEFRLGHLDQAESYLRADWLLTQTAVAGDHLGQVYEQEKKTEKAIHMYRLAMATTESGGASRDEIQKHLERLGGKAESTPMLARRPGESSGGELSQLRTIKLKRLLPGTASAEFFLLIGPGPKVEDVAFISGSEKLKAVSDGLFDADYKIAFPTGSSARLVRRAIVVCSPISGCQAVLYTPNSVNSVN
jgi:tetratricopeptide (TPR) repeat protein